MVRILLHLLLFIIPIAAYLAWVYYYRRRAAAGGGDVPEITRGGLFWSLIAGCILLIISFVALAVFTGEPPGSSYQSPRFEDGRIIGPKFD